MATCKALVLVLASFLVTGKLPDTTSSVMKLDQVDSHIAAQTFWAASHSYLCMPIQHHHTLQQLSLQQLQTASCLNNMWLLS